MKDRLMIVVFGILAATASLAAAGEAPRDGARWERAMDRIRENAPPDIQALIDKQRNGEKLTAEEQEKLRDFAAAKFGNRMGNNAVPPEIRELMAKRGRGEQLTKEEQQRLEEFQRDQIARDQINANRGRNAGPGVGAARGRFMTEAEFFVRVNANIHDAALLRAAEIIHKQGKHQEAADMLAGIAKDSPQPEVAAAAHFTAGRIYRKNLLLPDKAAEEFLAVRGPMAADAIREMTEMFLENGEPERAVKLLKDALLKAESKMDRLTIMMAVADACERAGQLDNAVTMLKEVADMFPYDEAMKLHMERDGRGAGEREAQR